MLLMHKKDTKLSKMFVRKIFLKGHILFDAINIIFVNR